MIAEHPLTGRKVALFFLLFFVFIACVNAVMIRAAILSFSGMEAKNPYEAGLAFGREIAAAAEQNERHWRVDASVQPLPSGTTAISITAKDKMGHALTDLDLDAHLVHPV